MLSKRYPLYDIRDVEAFCLRAIQRSGIVEFGYLDQDDLLSDLIAFCWALSESYDGRRGSFSSFAGGCVGNFIVEWKRSDFRTRWTFGDGTVYERSKPVFTEYDGALRETAVDSPERSDSDSEWLDPLGSIGAAAYLPPRGLRSARGARRPPDREPNRPVGKDREAA